MPYKAWAILFICLLASHLTGSEIQQQLKTLCASAPKGAQVGCVLMDCTNGELVFQSHANTPLRLASITKLLVSSAALCELGPDYRMRTSIHRIGSLQNSSIAGLGIIARGDPCMDEHFTNKKPDAIFESWAKQLKERGIHKIEGDLIIDTSRFFGPGKPSTYPQDHSNQQQWYSAPASAFAWNDNCIEVRAVPQANGTACRIETRPFSRSIKIINKSKSVNSHANKTFIVSRSAKSNTVIVSGKYKKTTSWFPLSIHENADLLAGDHCMHVLKKSGISITGHVKISVFAHSNETLLFEHSNTLLPALTILNQRSQNFYGEQVLRILGYHFRKQGSVLNGAAAVHAYLNTHLGQQNTDLTIVDGSGLSYDNKGSALDICNLLRAMSTHKYSKQFYETLRTPQYSWAKNAPSRLKTGSLSVARCLAGYIDNKSGSKRYAFAILLNKDTAKSISWASKLREQLFKTMLTHAP